MLHPDIQRKWISDSKGHGLFATKLIPKGTITYVQDKFDIVIHESDDLLKDPRYSKIIDRFTYEDGNGDLILSWDDARYMNHCCFANTLTTGFGFEIAIQDIKKGQEVTDDYGIFTRRHEMHIDCKNSGCRKVISEDDFQALVPYWDSMVKKALSSILNLKDQPLYEYLDDESSLNLTAYLSGKGEYRSVALQQPARTVSNLVYLNP